MITMEPRIKHGTQTAYRKHGCRCRPCKEWQNTNMRRYKARRKAREGKVKPAEVVTKDRFPIGHMIRVAPLNVPDKGEWMPMDADMKVLSKDYPEFAEHIAWRYDTEVYEFTVIPVRRSTERAATWYIRVR